VSKPPVVCQLASLAVFMLVAPVGGPARAAAQGRPKKPGSSPIVRPLAGGGGGGGTTYRVTVTPNGTELSEPPNTQNLTVVFTVRNTGTGDAGDSYVFDCSVTYGVTCVSVSPTSAGLNPGESVDVTLTYNTGTSSGSPYLLANGGHANGQGWYYVRLYGAPTITLKNYNGDNQDRSLCLTSGAGEAAAWQCGDLLVTHGLPGFATLGRDRSLTLLYTSAQAVPRPVVAASVEEANVGVPTTVFVRLAVNGVGRDSATYSGWGSQYTPTQRQVVLSHDAMSDASGIYPITLTVRNQYSGGTYDATISDTMIVVNRNASVYGAGWSLAGIEELRLNQPGNKILWIGGDGSAKAYRNVGTNVWQAAAGTFRDTLRYDATAQTYTRTLRHRVQVVFDAQGRHFQTVNRAGQTTQFYWNPTSGRLDSIAVPPAVTSRPVYKFTYD